MTPNEPGERLVAGPDFDPGSAAARERRGMSKRVNFMFVEGWVFWFWVYCGI
jgi:hypothetical protein